jgi:tetraacyldisaccharide 4'-kinase
MKLLRYLAFPLVPFYYSVTWIRNKAFDLSILKSVSYSFPVICVGNLSVGGTGKSPMVSYLIQLLKDDISIATLSRGYGRKTKGFVLAELGLNHNDLGDESFQYFQNFGNDITVAVSESRQAGIEALLTRSNAPEVIILDDAYQHRKVKAGFNILLSTFDNLFTNDIVLPTGNLREPKSGYKRAHCILVTKCPDSISTIQKQHIINKIKPLPYQKVFFSHINYSSVVKSKNEVLQLRDLPKFSLVTGIANAMPLVAYLKELDLDFNHLEYNDHYNFTKKDISDLGQLDLIVTTEKDYMRLQFETSLKSKLFYLPIELSIDQPKIFNTFIKDFVSNK